MRCLRAISAAVVLFLCPVLDAATGDISARIIRAEGWSMDLAIDGFVAGPTFDFNLDAGNLPTATTPYLTVVSQGYDNTGSLGTITRTVYITSPVNVPYSTATINVTAGVGTFVDGETVSQAISTATAVVVGNQSAGNAKLRFRSVTGTFNNVNVITGGTSGAVATSTSTITTLTLPANDVIVTSTGIVVRVALSDYVYLDDNTGAGKSGTAPTITTFTGNIASGGNNSVALTAAAVTQNSTQDYPNVIMRTVSLPGKLMTGAFTTEVQAFHRHAKDGKPVAVVVGTYTDGTVTDVNNVTEMSLSADADKLPVYAFPENASTFTQAASIVGNYVAYPWVGDADNVLNSSTNAWMNTGSKLSNLPVGVCDKDGTYGQYFCGWDTTNGSDANTTAYDTQGAAEAGLKTATMGQAIANIQARANSIKSRNTPDAGVVLMYGTNNLFGRGTDNYAANVAAAVTITRASTETRSSAIITGFNADSRFVNGATRLYDLSIVPSSNANQLIGFTPDNAPVQLEEVTLTGTGATTTNLFSSNTAGKPAVIHKNVTVTGYLAGVSGGNDCIALLVRGTSVAGATTQAFGNARAVVGSTLLNGTDGFIVRGNGAWDDNENRVITYNKAYNNASVFFINSGLSMTSYAFVANLDERVGADPNATFEMSGNNLTNLIFWHNTVAGQRVNTEGSTSTNYAYALNSFKFNSWYYNGQHNPWDAYSTVLNGAITGIWPYTNYSVGWVGNNSEITPNVDPGVFLGLRTTTETVAGYTSDRSVQGTDAGNGIYIPTAGSVLLNKVNDPVIPYGLDRLSIRSGGAAGAFQKPVTGGFFFFML